MKDKDITHPKWYCKSRCVNPELQERYSKLTKNLSINCVCTEQFGMHHDPATLRLGIIKSFKIYKTELLIDQKLN
jgi:hypothetical protein